jgi:hypothetical protein
MRVHFSAIKKNQKYFNWGQMVLGTPGRTEEGGAKKARLAFLCDKKGGEGPWRGVNWSLVTD